MQKCTYLATCCYATVDKKLDSMDNNDIWISLRMCQSWIFVFDSLVNQTERFITPSNFGLQCSHGRSTLRPHEFFIPWGSEDRTQSYYPEGYIFRQPTVYLKSPLHFHFLVAYPATTLNAMYGSAVPTHCRASIQSHFEIPLYIFLIVSNCAFFCY